MVTKNSIFWEQLLALGGMIEKSAADFRVMNTVFDQNRKEVIEKIDENLEAQKEVLVKVSESLRSSFSDIETVIANRIVERVTDNLAEKTDDTVRRISESSQKIVLETRSELSGLVQKAIMEKTDTHRIKWLGIACFCVLCLMFLSSVSTYYVVKRKNSDMSDKAAAVKNIYGENVFAFLSKNDVIKMAACSGMKKIESKTGQVWCYPINKKNEVIPYRID